MVLPEHIWTTEVPLDMNKDSFIYFDELMFNEMQIHPANSKVVWLIEGDEGYDNEKNGKMYQYSVIKFRDNVCVKRYYVENNAMENHINRYFKG